PLVRVVLRDAARPEDIVGDDQAVVGEERQRGLVVVDVALLVGVDEDEVERALERPHRLEAGPEPVVDPVGEAGLLRVAAGNLLLPRLPVRLTNRPPGPGGLTPSIRRPA